MSTVDSPIVAASAAPYLADYKVFSEGLNGAQPLKLKALRQEAMEAFGRYGFPTPRLESWRSTDLDELSEASFKRAVSSASLCDADETAIDAQRYAGCQSLVFVDGQFAPRLSRISDLPEGCYAGGLAAKLIEDAESVQMHLAKHAQFAKPAQALVALNTAFISDGAYIEVPDHQVIETPIQLIFASSQCDGDGEAGRVSFPRNLIVVGENAQVRVIESFVSLSEDPHFTCPVTEVVCGPSAFVDHYRVQKENHAAYHVSTLAIYQALNSTFDSHAVTHGGSLVRNDVVANLDAEGLNCTLNGLYVVEGKQHVDNQMRVEHAKPNCYSYELYKGILDGEAETVFNGCIHVHKGAQQTDAVQSNQNLLLSRRSTAHSNPQLEIFADDVRCTHGSTIGQLDEEAVFYLRSRGIGEEAAKSILTYAFAADIVERIKIDSVREELETFLFDRLPEGDVVRQTAF